MVFKIFPTVSQKTLKLALRHHQNSLKPRFTRGTQIKYLQSLKCLTGQQGQTLKKSWLQ